MPLAVSAKWNETFPLYHIKYKSQTLIYNTDPLSLYLISSVPAKWPLLRILIWMGMPVRAFLNLWAHHPWKKITRCSVACCENVITPAVSGPMPTTATQLAAETRWNSQKHTPALTHTHTEWHRAALWGDEMFLIFLPSTVSGVIMINNM